VTNLLSLAAPMRHLALVQPRVGIGDMIWHLPHLRALAGLAEEVTLVTRRRSHAAEFVGRDDGMDHIFFVERGQWDMGGRHQGAAGLLRLVADLRRLGCDGAILLTRSRVLTLTVRAAGIPRVHGYGIGWQRRLLRGPFLPEASWKAHPYAQATSWLGLAGVALGEPEPRLHLSDADRAAAMQEVGVLGAPVLGIASSDDWKNWGAAKFAGLAAALLEAGWPVMVLAGGPAEAGLADDITARLGPLAPRVRRLLGLNLRTLAAVLAGQAFYAGNDTAALNIAAAVGLRGYGLFGATPVLHHSGHIVPVVPPGGYSASDGMARLPVGMVLDAIAADRQRVGPP
jgi:heptosyltransferase-2